MNSQSQSQRPIFLVGMMGSGKSTVGKKLATVLGRAFIDADKELELRCGVPITTIFELEGEDGFRRREASLISDLTGEPGLVLATGGGAVLLPENRTVLHERGYVVYLKASVQDLWLRLRNDKVRPLLRTPDPRRRIAELIDARDPLYQACAHLTVATGRQPVERVVAAIVAALPQELRGTAPACCTPAQTALETDPQPDARSDASQPD